MKRFLIRCTFLSSLMKCITDYCFGNSKQVRILVWVATIPIVFVAHDGYAQCVQPPNGLVAWFPLDETSGATVNDISIVAGNGTYLGSPSHSPGMVAGALVLDGINDYVEVPNHAEINFGTNDFSMDAWV